VVSTKDKHVDGFEPVLGMSVGVHLKENEGIRPDGLRSSDLGGRQHTSHLGGCAVVHGFKTGSEPYLHSPSLQERQEVNRHL
jgi:hypothetical protein